MRLMSATTQEGLALPAPAIDLPASDATPQVAVFAGGCFWGVQGVYQHVKGVSNALSGYAGGSKSTAVYELTNDGTTGHAESVQVTFDPRQVTYGQLLQIFFSVAHDPTQLNRQGPDTGTQYRSTIFPANAEQAAVAKAYIAQLDAAHAFKRRIATTIEMGRTFYPAEKYHQDFLVLNPSYPYIVYNDLPKLENLKRLLPAMYRPVPVSRVREEIALPLHQLRQFVFHRLAPDVVALGQRVQIVGPERVRQEDALVVQELRADVQVEDVLLIVQPGDDPVGLGNLVAHRIAGHRAREDRQQQDLRVRKVLAHLEHDRADALRDFRSGVPAAVVRADHQHDRLRLKPLAFAVA